MTKAELTAVRDLAYSHWHRGHWTGHPNGACTYADIDGLEYCGNCGEPLLLKETARGHDRPKDHVQLRRLAERADLPAVLVFYQPGEPMYCEVCRHTFATIASVEVRDVYPMRGETEHYTAEEWSDEIERIHSEHHCIR